MKSPPEEAELCYEEGTHKEWIQPKALLTTSREEQPRGYPIAPTEFPKGRSATTTIGPREPPRLATYTPQVEGTQLQSHPKAVTGESLPPKI